METEALVMGGATVGVWTANIGLLIHHWRSRLLTDLPEVQRPYVMVVSGGVLLTLHVTFVALFVLSQVGALPPGLAATAYQPAVLWGFLALSLGFGILSVIIAWHLDFAPRMKRRLRRQQQDAVRDCGIEALNRIELALNEPLTELLFAVRASLHQNRLTAAQKANLEDAYRAGRQVVSILEGIAAEIENGNGNARAF
ncbi:MAG: hypothetical protein ACE5HV_00340 [Acidobacteriota bacterium]